MVRCAHCGATLNADARICPHCLVLVIRDRSNDTPPPKTATPERLTQADLVEPTAAKPPAKPAPMYAAASPSPAAMVPAASAAVAPTNPSGRPHSPTLALLFGVLIPGAGQAYNGRPIRGFFYLFLSILIFPYLLSLYGAVTDARRIVASGGRMGKGGLIWVFLQGWLYANVLLVVLIALTIAGVLT